MLFNGFGSQDDGRMSELGVFVQPSYKVGQASHSRIFLTCKCPVFRKYTATKFTSGNNAIRYDTSARSAVGIAVDAPFWQ